MMPVTESAPTPIADARRCVRCAALACARVTLPSGAELDFCRFHLDQHRDALITMSAVIRKTASTR